MAKPKPRKKQVVQLDERQQFELRTHLPQPPRHKPQNQPYLKSFAADKHPRIIGDSILRYTACSTKQWRTPEDRLPKRVFA